MSNHRSSFSSFSDTPCSANAVNPVNAVNPANVVNPANIVNPANAVNPVNAANAANAANNERMRTVTARAERQRAADGPGPAFWATDIAITATEIAHGN